MAILPVVEPAKRRPPPIQPNAHPYAIKTTSSALLSRSSSSPHSPHYARHNYIPSPPSRVPTGTRVGHCHSSPLSAVEGKVSGMCTIPPPLPTPPPVVLSSQDNSSVSLIHADELGLSHQAWRVETTSTETFPENNGYDQKHKLGHERESNADLPKQWNVDQLATCPGTFFKSGNSTVVIEDDSSLAGTLKRVRTRSLTDPDLVGTSLSDKQRAQFLGCGHNLNTDIHRGPTYVNSYRLYKVSNGSKDLASQSSCSSTPFHSVSGASVSADDLRLLLSNSGEGVSAYPLSPATSSSLRRSNSVSDATTQRYRDLARMRMRRRGRVKGLVETWERASTSGSESSTSDAETESETDPEESITRAKHLPELPSDPLSTLHNELPNNTRSSVLDSTVPSQDPPTLTPHPPHIHLNTALGSPGSEAEEPSIEELLASSSNIPLRGARAWEADFVLGETVKRVPIADAGSSSTSTLATEPSPPFQKDVVQPTRSDSVLSKGVWRNTGSRGETAKSRERVVTAIFTGLPYDDESENATDEVHPGGGHHYVSDMNSVVDGEAGASLELQNDQDSALRALERSIAVTYAQLEAFRLRLEKVEADTARQEMMLMQAQIPTSSDSAESETRRGRPKAAEAPPTDERSTDMLEGWETMSLADVALAVTAKTIGWLLPYGHLGTHAPGDHDQPLAQTRSRLGANDEYHSPAKRNDGLSVARMSCSIILASFAICAAIFRRMGFGRWIRRP